MFSARDKNANTLDRVDREMALLRGTGPWRGCAYRRSNSHSVVACRLGIRSRRCFRRRVVPIWSGYSFPIPETVRRKRVTNGMRSDI